MESVNRQTFSYNFYQCKIIWIQTQVRVINDHGHLGRTKIVLHFCENSPFITYHSVFSFYFDRIIWKPNCKKKIVNIPFTPMYTYKNWSSHYIKQALGIILGIILNILKCLLVGLKFHLNHPFLSTCKPIWVDLCCLYAVCCIWSYVIQMGKVDMKQMQQFSSAALALAWCDDCDSEISA